MNLNELLGLYQKNQPLLTLSKGVFHIPGTKIFLKNLHGSSADFVASTLFQSEDGSQFNHVFVLENAEDAAYFHNTLENLTNALNIFYFPSSFKTSKNFRVLNSSHVMLRTEALTHFSSTADRNRSGALVTYADSLFEKVVLPQTLKQNIIHIKKDDTLNLNSLIELFVMYGFVRTDFVYEPGQFALRGGILDIYSFGNDKPFRVELFGEDVDSIRIFNPENQLSERKLSEVSIIPNVETQFSTGEKVSLFEFLPENTIFWIKDWDVIQNIIDKQNGDLKSFLQSNIAPEEDEIIDETDETKILKEIKIEDFISSKDIENQLAKRTIIEFGYQAHLSQETIEWHTNDQPSFNRQFELLIANLKEHESKGYEIFIFAEQAKQLERLHTIFDDLQTDIKFNPILKSIHEGFIDEDLKIVCYTDHQIFQRYQKFYVKQSYNKGKALTLKALKDLQPGDYVTHIDYGVGVYSGLEKLDINGTAQEAVRIIYKDHDILYVNINSLYKISKYSGKEGTVPKINKLGSDAWSRLKEKTKTRVKELAFDLIKLYAARKAEQGFSFSPDNYMQTELEASFMYEDTPDQAKAIADVKKDMEKSFPMDRLVCGDVGFGKTEVAIRAAFKAC